MLLERPAVAPYEWLAGRPRALELQVAPNGPLGDTIAGSPVRAACGRTPCQALRRARQPVDWRSTAPGGEGLDLFRTEAAAARTVELDWPPVHPADSRCPLTARAVLPGDPLTRFYRVCLPNPSEPAGDGRGSAALFEPGEPSERAPSSPMRFPKRVVGGQLILSQT